MSLPVTVNPSSKEVSVDKEFVEELSPEQREDLETHLSQLNDLARQMVDLNGAVPPPPNQLTAQITQQAAKMRDTGIASLKKGKAEDAVKQLNLALGIALRRAPWEQTQHVVEEVASIIGPRADAYMATDRWVEAFGDSTLLTLVKPMDAASHFRKGRCYMAAKQYRDARQYLSSAVRMAPQNAVFKQFLADLDKEAAQ